MNSYLTFLGELPTAFKEIGSVCPSSPFLTNKLLESVPAANGPRRILEVGPGTGALTKRILEDLRPGDELVLYELNEQFVKSLKKLIGENGFSAKHVTVVHDDIKNLPVGEDDEKFDVIFCGIPFLNFDPEDVDEIIEVFKKSMARGGSLVFFGYLAFGKLWQPFRSKKERERISSVMRSLKEFQNQACETRVEKIFLNIPPAHGTMLRFD